jgi:ATP-binding cassette subfamily C protein
MSGSFKAYIREHGKEVDWSSASSYSIKNPDYVWLVLEGQAGLYFQTCSENRLSRLHPLMELTPGNIFFSPFDGKGDIIYSLKRDGNSTLYELNLKEHESVLSSEEFSQEIQQELLDYLKRWKKIYPALNAFLVGNAESSSWKNIFAEFPPTLKNCLYSSFRRKEEIELDRLKSRIQSSETNTVKALSSLASVVCKEGRIHLEQEYQSPLLNCLKLIGEYSGIPELCDFHGEIASVSTSEQDYIAVLESLLGRNKIKARQVMLGEPDWWKASFGPVLGFYSKEGEVHPVALIPAGADTYEIVDPKDNTRIPLNSKTESAVSVRGFCFYRSLPHGSIGFKEFFNFCLTGIKRELIVVVVMAALIGLLQSAVPIATGVIFSQAIPEANMDLLKQIFIILVSVIAARFAFSITEAVALLRIHGHFELNGQSALWDRLLSLPASFFRTYSAGDLAKRSLGLSAIQELIAVSALKSLTGCIFSVIFVALMFYYSSVLAVFVLLLSILFFTLTLSLGIVGIKYQKEMTAVEGKLAGIVLQFFDGIAKLRSAGVESKAFAIWAKDFSKQKQLFFNWSILSAVHTCLQAIFPILSLLLILQVYKYSDSVSHGIDAGKFMAFMSAFALVQISLFQLSEVFFLGLKAVPLWNRLAPILNMVPEVNPSNPSPGLLTGQIEVQAVRFRYEESGPLILENVSLSIRPGEFVAIVGDSGSGKSTLLRLLLGFESAESGGVYFDGKDIAEVDLVSLRQQIGVVLQNSGIVGGSIFENIIGQNNSLTIDHAWKAARLAGCEDDIREMPMQMHTVLSPGGGTLSGGQRQRIMIARALVRNPQIIFFDEATSALDNKTQSIVTESLEAMAVTRVVIAHRLSTIKNADRIYVMKSGKLVESGDYHSLMEEQGEFYRLAQRQII